LSNEELCELEKRYYLRRESENASNDTLSSSSKDSIEDSSSDLESDSSPSESLNARPQPLKSTDEILALKIEKYEELLKSIKEESSIIISEQEKVNEDLANLVEEQLTKGKHYTPAEIA
jgi:uncharacterized phage infection (PIP) family protein YhgE